MTKRQHELFPEIPSEKNIFQITLNYLLNGIQQRTARTFQRISYMALIGKFGGYVKMGMNGNKQGIR